MPAYSIMQSLGNIDQEQVKIAARIALRQAMNRSSSNMGTDGTQVSVSIPELLRTLGLNAPAVPMDDNTPVPTTDITIPVELQDAIADQLVEQYWPQIQYDPRATVALLDGHPIVLLTLINLALYRERVSKGFTIECTGSFLATRTLTFRASPVLTH